MRVMSAMLTLFLVAVAFIMFANPLSVGNYLPAYIDMTYIGIMFFVGVVLVLAHAVLSD